MNEPKVLSYACSHPHAHAYTDTPTHRHICIHPHSQSRYVRGAVKQPWSLRLLLLPVRVACATCPATVPDASQCRPPRPRRSRCVTRPGRCRQPVVLPQGRMVSCTVSLPPVLRFLLFPLLIVSLFIVPCCVVSASYVVKSYSFLSSLNTPYYFSFSYISA